MKTTIIEILNKIANGEEPPKKIKYKDDVCKWQNNWYFYDTDTIILDQMQIDVTGLNDEVEILETTITYKQDNIENNKQDKIKKIDLKELNENMNLGVKNDMYLAIKINEIIDKLNKEEE